MKLYYSKKLELANGDEVIIPINNGETGDVSTSELWVYTEDGNYAVDAKIGEEFVSLTKGVDMGSFELAETAGADRMLYVISDASAVKITASGDTTLEVKVIF